MRIINIEKAIYTFDELSEEAKDRVALWWNQGLWDDGIMHDNMQMIADGILEDAGFDPAKDLSYDLYGGSGVTFDTQTVAPIKLTEDSVKYHLLARCYRAGRGWFAASDIKVLDSDGEELESIDEEERFQALAFDLINELASKIMLAFREEDEYHRKCETVAELCDANGYEFDENGRIA